MTHIKKTLNEDGTVTAVDLSKETWQDQLLRQFNNLPESDREFIRHNKTAVLAAMKLLEGPVSTDLKLGLKPKEFANPADYEIEITRRPESAGTDDNQLPPNFVDTDPDGEG